MADAAVEKPAYVTRRPSAPALIRLTASSEAPRDKMDTSVGSAAAAPAAAAPAAAPAKPTSADSSAAAKKRKKVRRSSLFDPLPTLSLVLEDNYPWVTHFCDTHG